MWIDICHFYKSFANLRMGIIPRPYFYHYRTWIILISTIFKVKMSHTGEVVIVDLVFNLGIPLYPVVYNTCKLEYVSHRES